MSGIELARIVLAAIPLVIAALEHYEEALDSAIAFKKWNRELSTATQGLWFQHTSYVQSIQALLIPLTTDQEFHDMMDNIDSAMWKSPVLQEKLGEAYHPSMCTIRQIEGIIKSLAERLDIEGGDKVSQNGFKAIVLANPSQKGNGRLELQFSRRVKFTMKRRKLKRLLEEFDTCKKRLDSYTNKANRIEEAYRAQRKSKFAHPLRLIQENAEKLYNVLSRTWCTTRSTHHAGLLLEQRLAKGRKRMTSLPKQQIGECDVNCFGISLLQCRAPSEWHDAEFRLAEATVNEQQVSSGVRVVLLEPPPTKSPNAPYLEPDKLQVVTDQCSVLQKASHPLVGFCLDGEERLRGAYPAQPRALTYDGTFVRLSEMLVKGHRSLSEKQVYSLSITLSSSLLQLSHTPWLDRSWNKTDIIFPQAKDGSVLSVDVNHPYLTREHTSDKTGLIRRISETTARNFSHLGGYLWK